MGRILFLALIVVLATTVSVAASENTVQNEDADSVDSGENSSRSTRSIALITKLLTGGTNTYFTFQMGQMPPDHPLVKYPNPIQMTARKTNEKLLVALPLEKQNKNKAQSKSRKDGNDSDDDNDEMMASASSNQEVIEKLPTPMESAASMMSYTELQDLYEPLTHDPSTTPQPTDPLKPALMHLPGLQYIEDDKGNSAVVPAVKFTRVVGAKAEEGIPLGKEDTTKTTGTTAASPQVVYITTQEPTLAPLFLRAPPAKPAAQGLTPPAPATNNLQRPMLVRAGPTVHTTSVHQPGNQWTPSFGPHGSLEIAASPTVSSKVNLKPAGPSYGPPPPIRKIRQRLYLAHARPRVSQENVQYEPSNALPLSSFNLMHPLQSTASSPIAPTSATTSGIPAVVQTKTVRSDGSTTVSYTPVYITGGPFEWWRTQAIPIAPKNKHNNRRPPLRQKPGRPQQKVKPSQSRRRPPRKQIHQARH